MVIVKNVSVDVVREKYLVIMFLDIGLVIFLS